VVLEERESLTYRFAYGLLLLGEIGQEVDEDVGYRDAAGHREPYASGVTSKKRILPAKR
jgi:hypothetical protein